MRKRSASYVVMALMLLLAAGLPSSLDARPPHKKALADHFGPLLPKQLIDCRTCHVPSGDGCPVALTGDKLERVAREVDHRLLALAHLEGLRGGLASFADAFRQLACRRISHDDTYE